MTRRRTYGHLEGQGRKPSDYEVATSRLLYYPERGFEVQTPVAAWHRRHVDEGSLRCRDWERFRDPRETTYAAYTTRRARQEVFVDGLLEAATRSDARLAPDWVRVLERVLPPLRFPLHGLQMTAAYAGSLAPSGRLVVAWLFQAADELRRVQRLAYRMRQVQETFPGFGGAARALWQDDPRWQPWRRVIEELLVVRDLGHLFAALNLVIKPAFDEQFFGHFAARGRAAGDDVLHLFFQSLGEDGAWHAEWTEALRAMLVADDARNAGVLEREVARWRPRVAEAVLAAEGLFEGGGDET